MKFLVIANLGSSYIQQLPDKHVPTFTEHFFRYQQIWTPSEILNQLRCPTKKNLFVSEVHFVLTKCKDITIYTIQNKFFPKHIFSENIQTSQAQWCQQKPVTSCRGDPCSKRRKSAWSETSRPYSVIFSACGTKSMYTYIYIYVYIYIWMDGWMYACLYE